MFIRSGRVCSSCAAGFTTPPPPRGFGHGARQFMFYTPRCAARSDTRRGGHNGEKPAADAKTTDNGTIGFVACAADLAHEDRPQHARAQDNLPDSQDPSADDPAESDGRPGVGAVLPTGARGGLGSLD